VTESLKEKVDPAFLGSHTVYIDTQLAGRMTHARLCNMQNVDLEAVQRFWKHAPLTDTCWLWDGQLTKAKYGQFSLDKKTWLVHRLAYTFAVGPIPEGLDVIHTCKVRHCVNPSHLYAGRAPAKRSVREGAMVAISVAAPVHKKFKTLLNVLNGRRNQGESYISASDLLSRLIVAGAGSVIDAP
jgi:hypothetical protein